MTGGKAFGSAPATNRLDAREVPDLFDDYNAVFFSMWAAVPVFHGFDFDKVGSTSTDYTRCGLVIASYDSATGRSTEPGTWLPMRHAVKFGKPCRKCFRALGRSMPDAQSKTSTPGGRGA